jgi:hypothetical protein
MSVGVDGVVARGGADREAWLAASAAVSAIFFKMLLFFQYFQN